MQESKGFARWSTLHRKRGGDLQRLRRYGAGFWLRMRQVPASPSPMATTTARRGGGDGPGEVERERHVHHSRDDEIGRDRAGEEAEERRGEAESAVFEGVGRQEPGARRAERLQDDRVVEPGPVARRERAAEHEQARDERDRARAADRHHELRDDVVDGLERVLDPHARHGRKGEGGVAQDRSASRRRARAVREGDRGEMRMRRAGEGVGREHHDEVDAERAPFDLAQVGDRRGDVAAEHVDGDLVADLEAEPLGDPAVEGDERLAACSPAATTRRRRGCEPSGTLSA